jgi:diguanylate cyclase (GGDEF)-like protein
MPNQWILELRETNREIKEHLMTKKDFVRRLKVLLKKPECPIAGIQYKIDSPKPFKDVKIRIPKIVQNGRSCDEYIIILEDTRRSKCYLSIWKKNNSVVISNEIVKLVRCLLKNYWKPYFRTLPIGLIDFKRNDKINRLAKKTFTCLMKEHPPVSLLYCDIDNFKEVNLKFGPRHGDIILKEIGATLESITTETAILLHNSGDEFLIFVTGSTRIANKLADDIKRAIATQNFGTDSIHLDISIGISSSCETQDFDTMFDSSYNDMENAKKSKNNLIQ